MKTETATIQVKHFYNFPPERVFDAWIVSDIARKWLFATPAGEIVKADIDAKVGGGFRLVDRRDGEDIEHVGKYLEIDRPRRLVFTFSVPKFSSESTTVTIDVIPRDEGCELALSHEGVLPDWRTQTESGWTNLLEALEANA